MEDEREAASAVICLRGSPPTTARGRPSVVEGLFTREIGVGGPAVGQPARAAVVHSENAPGLLAGYRAGMS
jgi:hypothetical protein